MLILTALVVTDRGTPRAFRPHVQDFATVMGNCFLPALVPVSYGPVGESSWARTSPLSSWLK
jgi:hypothetical protein